MKPFIYHAASNEIVEEATMQKPDGYDKWAFMWPELRTINYLNVEQDVFKGYRAHIASLLRHTCHPSCKEVWKDGEDVTGKFELKTANIDEALEIILNQLTLQEQEEIGYILDADNKKDADWRNEHYGINRSDVIKGLYIHTGNEYIYFNDNREYIGYEQNGKFKADPNNEKAYQITYPLTQQDSEEALTESKILEIISDSDLSYSERARYIYQLITSKTTQQ